MEFATTPASAKTMIERVLGAGAPAAWLAGDEVDGADPALRRAIAEGGWGFVLAVANSHRFATGIGARRAIDLAVRLPASAGQPTSAGAGAKGQCWQDWALVEATDPALSTGADQTTEATTGGTTDGPTRGVTGLLIQRTIGVAGTRWKIAESFAGATELTALDTHQVRTPTCWHRWTLLAMLAHPFRTVLAVKARPRPAPERVGIADPDKVAISTLIPLTRNEIRRRFTGIRTLARDIHHRRHRSNWRRHHQAVARASHHKQRKAAIT